MSSSSPRPPPPQQRPDAQHSPLDSQHGEANAATCSSLPLPDAYLDPTPATPMTSRPPSRSPSKGETEHRDNDDNDDNDDDDDDDDNDDNGHGDSRSEIQSIMEQFSQADGCGPGEEEVMSPRLELASGGSMHHHHHHLPRHSSLDATSLSIDSPPSATDQGPPVPPKDSARPRRQHDGQAASSPSSPVHRPPPPQPEPESALPFDFHRFLEQLRNKKADGVARYLKSFLSEFGKRQWMVHEQVKIIGDFLAFIANKMVLCDVWANVSDAELDNAREGMEKLVMNRLYSQTFSPAIAPPKPIPGAKPRRRGGDVPMGPGRRGQHQEDVERDDILAQKINIYAWVKEEHLDIAPLGESGHRFLKLAQQELLKIKSYRAPRDKIICVLNCSKVIFGLLRHNKSDSSADSFMPLLIYVVLQSNPEHLVSNVQYIVRFRNQDKLAGEAGYYLSSLMGAIQFIENMDRSSLTISDKDFESNVEAAVSAIAEKHQATSSPVILQHSTFAPQPLPSSSSSSPGPLSNDQGAAMTGILRSIQKPLSTIGRIFSDEASSTPSPPLSAPPSPTAPQDARRSRPAGPAAAEKPLLDRLAQKPQRLSACNAQNTQTLSKRLPQCFPISTAMS
ncbi:hypothetical protein CDD82_214 [Ophiocordyceps australis]|uniref:VPS9 domain-containing protein n=1 Tax=Ophiocordyceps australis TaxID=1399860 RepID=A0A2C5ZQT8_9HYPO|nr:hypothetical protein CDD82_214 [Ophiocordyceps australis]